MKRRDFLLASTGLAGAMIPGVGRSQSPCPPATVSVAGGTQSTKVCTSAGNGTAPKWFLELPERVWTEIAAGTDRSDLEPWQRGERINELIVPAFGKSSNRPVGLFAYSGGAVDQAQAAFAIWGGGHDAGWDNGVYEIGLLEDVPSWKALTIRSDPRYPESYMAKDADGNYIWYGDFDKCQYELPIEQYEDGQPVASHTTYNCAWDPVTQSYWMSHIVGDASSGPYVDPVTGRSEIANDPLPGATQSRWCTWRLDRKTRRWIKMNNDPRLGKKPGDPSADAWQVNGTFLFNAFYGHMVEVDSADSFSVDLQTGTRTLLNLPKLTGGVSPWGGVGTVRAAAAIADDYHKAIASYFTSYRIWLIDAANYNARAPRDITPESYPWSSSYRPGMVWHAATRGFLFYGDIKFQDNEDTEGIYVLHQPDDDWWGGQWKWTRVLPANSADSSRTIPTPEKNSGTYGRFNLVKNVGGSGHDALVYTNALSGPCYLMKLPSMSLVA